jgi:hypothetical protein
MSITTLASPNDPGYEDIQSDQPYIDSELDGNRALLHMMYVPPNKRRNGEGKALFKGFLASLPSHIQYVRLKSASLSSGDTMAYWKTQGFTPAYNCTCKRNMQILHLAVNGFALPAVETVQGEDERHYIFD